MGGQDLGDIETEEGWLYWLNWDRHIDPSSLINMTGIPPMNKEAMEPVRLDCCRERRQIPECYQEGNRGDGEVLDCLADERACMGVILAATKATLLLISSRSYMMLEPLRHMICQ